MPCCYFLKDANSTVTFATDLGFVSDEIQECLNTSNCNILEANYDKIMLEYGKYPPSIKGRIRGKFGHLSNDDTAKAVFTVLKNNPDSKFIFSHLSENNNTEALAKSTICNYLNDNNITKYDISFATMDVSYERYEI